MLHMAPHQGVTTSSFNAYLVQAIQSLGAAVQGLKEGPKKTKRSFTHLPLKPEQEAVMPHMWPYVTFLNEHGSHEQILPGAKCPELTLHVLKYVIGPKDTVSKKSNGIAAKVRFTPYATRVLFLEVGNRCLLMPPMLKQGTKECIISGDIMIFPRPDKPKGSRYVMQVADIEFIGHGCFKSMALEALDDWSASSVDKSLFLKGGYNHRLEIFTKWLETSFINPEIRNVENKNGDVFEVRCKSIEQIGRGGLAKAMMDHVENDGLIFQHNGIHYKWKNKKTDDLVIMLPTAEGVFIPDVERKLLLSKMDDALPFYPFFVSTVNIETHLLEVPCYHPHARKYKQFQGITRPLNKDVQERLKAHLVDNKSQVVGEVYFPSAEDAKAGIDEPTLVQLRLDKKDSNTHGTLYTGALAHIRPITMADFDLHLQNRFGLPPVNEMIALFTHQTKQARAGLKAPPPVVVPTEPVDAEGEKEIVYAPTSPSYNPPPSPDAK